MRPVFVIGCVLSISACALGDAEPVNVPKFCGLTGIHGTYNVNSWTDGALIAAPLTVGGNWSMT